MEIRLHDRYLLSEIRGPFLISLAACLMMMIVQELYTIMDLLASHRFPIDTLGLYLLYKLPLMTQKSLPVAVLLGSSLAISRLLHQGEMTPVRISGLPLWRFLIPIAVVGFVFSLFSLILGERITPAADHRAEALYRELTFQTAVAGLLPDTFFRYENRLFYFHTSFSPTPGQTVLNGVIVYELPPSFQNSSQAAGIQPTVFWTAERGRVNGEIWILENVIQHDIASDGQIVSDQPMKTLRFNLHRSIQFFLNTEKKPQEMTAAELRTRINEDERLSVPAAVILPLRYEYWFRWALPFACMVFAIVSAPLTLRFSRGGSLVGILVSFGVLFFYYDLLVIAEKLAVAGAAPAGIAAWLPNLLFGALGISLILREP